MDARFSCLFRTVTGIFVSRQCSTRFQATVELKSYMKCSKSVSRRNHELIAPLAADSAAILAALQQQTYRKVWSAMQKIEDISDCVFKNISVVLVASPHALEHVSSFPWVPELLENNVCDPWVGAGTNGLNFVKLARSISDFHLDGAIFFTTLDLFSATRSVQFHWKCKNSISAACLVDIPSLWREGSAA